jgi:hypothetical protein
MDPDLWKRAAQEYAARKQQAAQPAQQADPPRPPIDRAAIATAASALQGFLGSSEGATAMQLLAASGQHIIIAQTEPGMGYTTVYYLDATGLHSSVEATGMWVAYTRPPAPKIGTATCEEAVSEAVFQGRRAEEVLPEIILELNAIAVKVVSPS